MPPPVGRPFGSGAGRRLTVGCRRWHGCQRRGDRRRANIHDRPYSRPHPDGRPDDRCRIPGPIPAAPSGISVEGRRAPWSRCCRWPPWSGPGSSGCTRCRRRCAPPGSPPPCCRHESGLLPQQHAVSRYHARWYAVTVLFLAFDMEMIFMYPWAVVVADMGTTAVVEMFGFLAVLLVGVTYVWREGALRWT
ncbi:NADH-quinone oxidoreductase subunit A [Blastococcus sp. TML/C7B]|uniref:NADH-quinone oxidoreductase subunit A n=1 Tax=Blastococcus sp. TML/C7B TaxID=2798728 RepID=UPI002814DDDA|nr:NADH-quinone oxidoreductase subunit A [Blastococcus sp. TML/C7B]